MSGARAGSVALALGVAACGLWIGKETLGVALAKKPAAAATLGESAATAAIRSRRMLETGDSRAAIPIALGALRRDPTVVAAIQTIGLAAQAGGDAPKAGRLLSHAQRLSRRDLQTHLWAIEHHVARGDTQAVLNEYDLTLRTSLASRELLFPVLGNAIAEQAVARGLIAGLTRKPLWGDAFLFHVANDARVVPETAVGFLRQARSAGLVAPAPSLVTLVARSLAAGAPTAWAAYTLKRPGVDPRRPRDPQFRALADDPAVFDWTLSNDGSILAQPDSDSDSADRGGGLRVEAGSGSAGIAAGQLQMLPPGRYRLIVDAGAVDQGASLSWAVTCRDGAELAKLLIAGPAARHASPAFAVPASCVLQDLKLTADAGESPQGLRVVIARTTIEPLSR